MMNSKLETRRYMVTSLFFILFLFLLASFYEIIRFDSIFKLGRCALSQDYETSSQNVPSTNIASPPEESPKDDDDEVRLLIGIMTLPNQYNRRHFLRLIYGTQQTSPNIKVDVKFVFCNLTNDDQKFLVSLEIMRYDDIIILNCEENMNKGKTYTYFSSLPNMFLNDTESSEKLQKYPPYHYVLKGDDDVYFRINILANSLRPLPRNDLYYGFVIPCSSMDPFVHYMSGMGYVVSWDIVEWIKNSEIPKKHLDGPEDRTFGAWMREGHRAKNRYNAKWSMYNYPDPAKPSACTHELWNDTIAVHLLKNQEKWIKTLRYFNVTDDLKPSKLYHL